MSAKRSMDAYWKLRWERERYGRGRDMGEGEISKKMWMHTGSCLSRGDQLETVLVVNYILGTTGDQQWDQ